MQADAYTQVSYQIHQLFTSEEICELSKNHVIFFTLPCFKFEAIFWVKLEGILIQVYDDNFGQVTIQII